MPLLDDLPVGGGDEDLVSSLPSSIGTTNDDDCDGDDDVGGAAQSSNPGPSCRSSSLNNFVISFTLKNQ